MLFSVVVPIYNVEKYLRKCIESILSQTYSDFELILVDDGSSDGCPAVCDEYSEKDGRVSVIHKENGGATSARKAGMNMARGEFIVSVDSDDYIEPFLLEKMKEILSLYPCDIVCFGYDTFPDAARKTDIRLFRQGYYDKKQIADSIFPALITGENGVRFPPSLVCKVFRRDLIVSIQNNLSENIIIGEDSCVSYAAIYRADNMYILHENLYRYRINNASVTRSRKAFDWDEPLLRAEFYYKFIPKSLFEDQVIRITAHSLFNVAISVLRAKKYSEAKREIKEKLSQEKFRYFLEKAKFKNKKERLALFCLKKKLISFLKLLSVYV